VATNAPCQALGLIRSRSSSGRENMGLPDPVTMLAMLGIEPTGSQEVEVVRLVER